MLRPAAVLLVAGCLVASGCGGGSSVDGAAVAATTTSPPPAGTLEALWRSARLHPSVIPGSSDYQPGSNRISFLLVDQQARVIDASRATVWVATGLRARPYLRTTARSEPIGVPGGASAGIGSILVAHVRLPKAGKYWLLASPEGSSAKLTGLANLVVGRRPDAPAVGERAVASKTPTLASAHGRLSTLSTATHPDPALYRISVAQAIARHVPFVVTFATPKFCQSRTCGPVVDVVDAVAKKLARTPVRFIHVEIYTGNDPAKGFNRWVREWNLPNEPFTFAVDRTGIVRAKLSGAFSVGELEQTVRATLLR
jgi:hypothetical protein